jgi:Na+-transporting methylmalonyl-CoA/oxaloacetate decarboxylase gamma subunit
MGISERRSTMKRGFVYVLVVLFALAVGVGAMAQEKAPAKAKPEKAPAKAKPEAKRERVVTLTGTVEAIDMANKVVTIKGSKGRVVDLKVGDQAKNLDQVKVGDKVVAKYYESIAYRLMKPGEAEGAKAEQTTAGAKPGEAPAGAIANQVTVTATVEEISPKKTYVTLKGPDGKSVDVKVLDPKNIEGLKAGDKVVITYTQALAIALDKPKPQPQKK